MESSSASNAGGNDNDGHWVCWANRLRQRQPVSPHQRLDNHYGSGVDPFVQLYGILAGPSNIGEYDRNRFGFLTEAQFEVGYWVARRVRLKAGYNFISLSNVVRPGSLIDLNVNGTQIDPNVANAGPANPSFSWDDEALILHGFNVGAEFRF